MSLDTCSKNLQKHSKPKMIFFVPRRTSFITSFITNIFPNYYYYYYSFICVYETSTHTKSPFAKCTFANESNLKPTYKYFI